MFSLHSIPLKDRKAGDTYCEQVEATRDLVAAKLGVFPDRIAVAYQSMFGHKKDAWVGPFSLDVLQSWRDEGDFRVLFLCPGFSIECLETLYDIPHEMCPALEGSGCSLQDARRFVWVPALGTSDAHAAVVKHVLDDAMRGWQ